MNVLLIDNGTKYLERIAHIVGRKHSYDVVVYDPHTPMDDTGYDVIVLSGGMVHEVEDILPDGRAYFHHQIDLIRNTELPILGICLGLQMVTVALGGTLQQLPELIHEYDYPLTLTKHGQELLGTDQIAVHERHQWAINSIQGTGLRVLAEGPDCIELLYHPERNIIATQFHPEHDMENDTLFWNLFDIASGDIAETAYSFGSTHKGQNLCNI